MSAFPGSLMAIASALPAAVLGNDELARQHPDWQVALTAQKTGVFERRIAGADETAYDLGLSAARKLLEQHPGLQQRIGAVIFCTQSPDHVMPSNAFLLQRDLGLGHQLIAFDYNLACSGYVMGLLMASSLMKTGIVRHVLLVTADTYSKYIADDDRATRMLFGDGAAASWIGQADDAPQTTPLLRSFDDFQCASDGAAGWDKFIIHSGGARQPLPDATQGRRDDKIFMNGLQVVNFVNHKVIKQIQDLLDKHRLRPDQIDRFFVHQGSKLALDSIAKRLKLDARQVPSNLDSVGNLVASSIPVLMHDQAAPQRPAAGSRVLLCGFGVGFSWASLLATA
jgi:3-oxoacyl-[acyl-carrier-protein] synthase III